MPRASNRVAVAILSIVLTAVACSRPSSNESPASRADSAASPTPRPDSAVAGADLRSTDWKLVALGDKPVTPTDTARAAHITLQPDSKQVAGSGGCNRLFGVYELNGQKLRFSGVGSTKMACKDGMDTESEFLKSLLRVAGWRINSQQLELTDSAGVVLARFEARPKK
jgi:heat shock protein HslJ